MLSMVLALESLTFFIIGRNYTILDLARQVKRLFSV
jgi:hypothetical protein